MSPAFASCERDTTILISGDLFRPTDTLRCRVGDTLVSATFMSSMSITCTYTSRVGPGFVDIGVTNNGVDFVAAGNITFLPATTVTELSPSSGPLSGGIGITLTGTEFSAVGAPSCSFGGIIVPAKVVTATEAVCTAPAATGAMSSSRTALSTIVTFSNSGVDFDDYAEDSTHLGGVFWYYPEPRVLSLAPSGGITNGDAVKVVMNGANFDVDSIGQEPRPDNQLLCRLGEDGQLTNGVIVSPTSGVCEISCGNYSGRAIVKVSLNGGAYWTASDVEFGCDPLPVVTSISPLLGPTSGGTTLTVQGLGFVPSISLSCLVGGGEDNDVKIQASWLSSTAVECLTPAAGREEGPANVSVSVSNDGLHFSSPIGMAVFEYRPSPTIARVSPMFASISGNATPLTVRGTNFVNSCLASCKFTTVPSDSVVAGVTIETQSATTLATFLTVTAILCHVPGHTLPPGSTALTVSVNGIDFIDSGAMIELEALPEVTNIVPSRAMAGPTVTPVEVSISDENDNVK